MSKIIQERKFRENLQKLLNEYSREHESNTPDFILARFILEAVKAFDNAANTRDVWYEHHCSDELKEKIHNHGLSQPNPTGDIDVNEEHNTNDKKRID